MFCGVAVSFHNLKGLIVFVLLSKTLLPLGSRLPRLVRRCANQEFFTSWWVCNVTNFWLFPQKAVPLYRDSAETSAALLGMWVATKFSRCGFCHLATTVALLARRVATLLYVAVARNRFWNTECWIVRTGEAACDNTPPIVCGIVPQFWEKLSSQRE